MTDWQTVSLDQIGRIITGKTPKTSNQNYYGGNIPFVTPSDMVDNRYIQKTGRYLTSEGKSSVSNALIPAGAVMVSCIGSDMGKSAIAKHACVTNQQINSIVTLDSFNSLFLYYNLSKRREEIRNSASGSAQPILNKSAFGRLQIKIPPLAMQNAIASILDSLDNKIELNRRTNETLEAMARALFRDWFVDFGPTRAKMAGEIPYLAPELWELFPDRLDDEEKPEGWLDGTLEDIANLQNGYAFKSSDWLVDGIPVVKIGAVKPSVVDLKNVSFVDSKFLKEKPNFILKSGDILIGLTGYVGEVGRVPPSQLTPMLNQRVARFLPGPSFYAYIFCVGRQKEFKEFVENQAHGSAQANVSTKDVLTYPIVIPTTNLSALFDENVALILEKIDENLSEIDTLTQLRDLLLPKLMSGEISIGDAEKMVEDAA